MVKILLFVIVLYLAIVLFFYTIQRSLIYFPDAHAPTPEEAGVPEMEEIQLQTKDGLSIKVWTRPAESNLPTIVYFHGNASHIGNRAPIIKPFLDKGYGVLLLTYRGYSGNSGKPSEKGLYADARAVMEYLKQQEVTSNCVVLWGNSIGSAVAIQMATEYPVGVLILQSPFPSLGAMGQYHMPFLPVRLFLKDKYDNLAKISQFEVPTLILQGEEDTIVPPKFSRQLFEALKEPKELHSIPGRGHNNLFEPTIIDAFIKKWACR